MKILTAEDESVSRLLLNDTLREWGYNVISATTGREALDVLNTPEPPRLAIVDWMMPEMDGVEFTRAVRQTESRLYIIVLTANSAKEGVVAALRAGADDYLTKPFDRDELHARLQAGVRIVQLQAEAAARIVELQQALADVKQLQGLLPICSYCHKIRQVGDGDSTYWSQIEQYITEHTDAVFSHGVCPACEELHVKPDHDKFIRQNTLRQLSSIPTDTADELAS